jgi:hypothetical protein
MFYADCIDVRAQKSLMWIKNEAAPQAVRKMMYAAAHVLVFMLD